MINMTTGAAELQSTYLVIKSIRMLVTKESI